MKPSAPARIPLILLRIAALAFPGITYTSRDTVVDLGPLRATAEREHTIPLSPIVGIAGIATGALLLFVSARSRA